MTKKQINIEYTEYACAEEMSQEDRDLCLNAIEATKTAYTPYSRFKVGAAVRLSGGSIVRGSNQENIAYPSGLCAERTAMFYAAASHPGERMEALAIAAIDVHGKLCETPATPCGACRQVMAEYQTLGGEPMEIILVGSGKIWKFSRVDDLLPLIFDSL